jgi:hypothetical protein
MGKQQQMPQCTNDASKRYTALERSPRGRGYAASGESKGTVKKGKDGNLWIVTTTRNHQKRWKLYEKTVPGPRRNYKCPSPSASFRRTTAPVPSSAAKESSYFMTSDDGANPFMMVVRGDVLEVKGNRALQRDSTEEQVEHIVRRDGDYRTGSFAHKGHKEPLPKYFTVDVASFRGRIVPSTCLSIPEDPSCVKGEAVIVQNGTEVILIAGDLITSIAIGQGETVSTLYAPSYGRTRNYPFFITQRYIYFAFEATVKKCRIKACPSIKGYLAQWYFDKAPRSIFQEVPSRVLHEFSSN